MSILKNVKLTLRQSNRHFSRILTLVRLCAAPDRFLILLSFEGRFCILIRLSFGMEKGS